MPEAAVPARSHWRSTMPPIDSRFRPRLAAVALVLVTAVAACAPPGTPLPGEPGSILTQRQAGGSQSPRRVDTDPIERGPNPAVIGRPAS
jgi:hypothetical protein